VSGIPIVALLTADALGILSEFGPPQWGIFDQDGNPVLVSDATGEVEYQREYDVSDYPQEQGAFESYNKVQIPYSAKVTLLSSQTREELLNTLEDAVASLDLVAVVMPELSYPSANLLRYSFRRTSKNGVTMIAVDVWCKEIRVVSNSPTQGAANPASAGQQQGTGGTDRPVGTVNGGSGLVPGGTQPSGTPAAISTGSTNSAYPTQSGPVQPVSPPSPGSTPGVSVGPGGDMLIEAPS
jgi:hypothetical protein